MFSSIMKCVALALALVILSASAHPVTGTHHLSPRQLKHRANGSRRTCKNRPVITESAPTPTGTVGFASEPVPSPTRITSTSTRGSDDDEEEEPTQTRTSTRVTSKAPEPTSGGGNGGGAGSNALFPAGRPSGSSWTTSQGLSGALPLNDGTLRPGNLMRSLPHPFVDMAGKRAMKAHFPKGSYTFGHQPQGGLSFYAPGPANVDLTDAKEATFGYSVYFPAGFNFQKGGKLPGLYGGDSAAAAVGCSGGRRSDECFSARLMFRSGGAGEFYTYLPPYTTPAFAANKKQCNVSPSSDCNPTYGASVGRGAFTFATGRWTTVTERVKLNDVGQANGEIELFVNGKSEISVKGLILRARGAGKLRGIQMQTFFGGSNPSFASPKDQDVYFADFSVAITERF